MTRWRPCRWCHPQTGLRLLPQPHPRPWPLFQAGAGHLPTTSWFTLLKRDFLSNIGLRTDEKIWHCYIFPDLPEIWYFQFTLEGNGFNWTQRSVSCSNTFKTLNGRSLTSDFQLFLAIKKHLFWGRQRGQVLCNAMHLPIWIPVSESFIKCRIRSAKVCFN